MFDTVSTIAPIVPNMVPSINGFSGFVSGAALTYCAYLFANGSRPGSTSASTSLSYQLKSTMEEIDSIAALKAGWAGDGSIAPSVQVIGLAREVALQICSKALFVDIAPMPNGTIAFDWETDKGSANLEIGERSYSFYLETNEDESFYPLSGPVNSIPLDLGELISEKLMPLVPSAVYSRPRMEFTNVSRGSMFAYG